MHVLTALIIEVLVVPLSRRNVRQRYRRGRPVVKFMRCTYVLRFRQGDTSQATKVKNGLAIEQRFHSNSRFGHGSRNGIEETKILWLWWPAASTP